MRLENFMIPSIWQEFRYNGMKISTTPQHYGKILLTILLFLEVP